MAAGSFVSDQDGPFESRSKLDGSEGTAVKSAGDHLCGQGKCLANSRPHALESGLVEAACPGGGEGANEGTGGEK